MADLKELLGERVDFFGVDNNAFCISHPTTGRVAFEAIEDEDDGYRSMLKEVKEVPLDGLVFFGSPVTSVTVRDIQEGSSDDIFEDSVDNSFEGYVLVDDAGHEWLRLGTGNYNDYYPCFTFRYNPPKTPAEVQEG